MDVSRLGQPMGPGLMSWRSGAASTLALVGHDPREQGWITIRGEV